MQTTLYGASRLCEFECKIRSALMVPTVLSPPHKRTTQPESLNCSEKLSLWWVLVVKLVLQKWWHAGRLQIKQISSQGFFFSDPRTSSSSHIQNTQSTSGSTMPGKELVFPPFPEVPCPHHALAAGVTERLFGEEWQLWFFLKELHVSRGIWLLPVHDAFGDINPTASCPPWFGPWRCTTPVKSPLRM